MDRLWRTAGVSTLCTLSTETKRVGFWHNWGLPKTPVGWWCWWVYGIYMGSIWDLSWSYYPLKIVGVVGCGMFLLVRDLRDPNSRRCDVHLWFDISWDDHINRKPCFGIGGSADVRSHGTDKLTMIQHIVDLDTWIFFFCEALLGVKIPSPPQAVDLRMYCWSSSPTGKAGLRWLAVEVWTGHRRRSQRGSGYAAAVDGWYPLAN